MKVFKHVSRVNVSLWGRRVGTLVELPRRGVYAFRYEKSFLSSGVQIAPLMMPLRAEPYAFPDLPRGAYEGLPPIFADSLPDAFGRGLIDHWLKTHGLSRDEITPLDRLCYLGRRTMGALTYEPDRGPGGLPTAIEMRHLVESARRVLNGDLIQSNGEDALREIIRLGSSAGGAQAKAVVGWNRKTDAFLLGDRDLPDGYEHWIVKFTPADYPWRGEREYAQMESARAAGIETSECRLVEVDGLGHFMTRRFDRDGNVRHHQATLSALAFHMIGMDVPFQQHRASWKMGGLPQGRDSAWHVDGRRRPGLCGTEDRRDRDAVAEDAHPSFLSETWQCAILRSPGALPARGSR